MKKRIHQHIHDKVGIQINNLLCTTRELKSRLDEEATRLGFNNLAILEQALGLTNDELSNIEKKDQPLTQDVITLLGTGGIDIHFLLTGINTLKPLKNEASLLFDASDYMYQLDTTLNISLAEVAEVTNTPLAKVLSYYKGVEYPPLSFILKIASLGFPIHEIAQDYVDNEKYQSYKNTQA